MSRYRRVNIDGKSMFKTETRLAAVALMPGTFAYIDVDDKFAVAPSGNVGRLYVVDCAHHEGLSIEDQIPVGHSVVGNYVEEAREFAVRVAAGTYSKDQPIALGASGMAVASSTNVIGFCQDDAVLASEDFIRIRMRTTLVTPAVATLVVLPATVSIAPLGTTQLVAAVSPSNANQGVTWASSDATKATVSATGLVTGVATGSATITATAVGDNTKTDTTVVTVTA